MYSEKGTLLATISQSNIPKLYTSIFSLYDLVFGLSTSGECHCQVARDPPVSGAHLLANPKSATLASTLSFLSID